MEPTHPDPLVARAASITPSLLAVAAGRTPATALVVAPGRAVTTAQVAAAGLRGLDHRWAVREVRVLDVDRSLDLALLAVDPDLPPATWGETPQVGERVLQLALGERGLRARNGVIAELGGAWRTHDGATIDRWIDVDGSLPLGFGGGPLVGASGVYGLNLHALVSGGCTLPRGTIERALEALGAEGRGAPGQLGVRGVGARLSAAQAAVAGQATGLLVMGVGDPGPSAGVLAVGDLILRAGGVEVTSVASLRGALHAIGAGRPATLAVLSGTTLTERTVTLGNDSETQQSP